MKPRHARPELDGWRAMRARSDVGAFESDERVRVAGPVVEYSEHGARVLADRYWLEVERASRRVVRRRDTSLGLELRLLSDEALHEWRKRSKDLWYHLRHVTAAGPR